MQGGIKKSRFSTNISLYHRNVTWYGYSYYGMRIGIETLPKFPNGVTATADVSGCSGSLGWWLRRWETPIDRHWTSRSTPTGRTKHLSSVDYFLIRLYLYMSIIGTCEASRFDSNSNRTSRFDSKVTGHGPIRKFRIAAPATFAVVL